MLIAMAPSCPASRRINTPHPMTEPSDVTLERSIAPLFTGADGKVLDCAARVGGISDGEIVRSRRQSGLEFIEDRHGVK